MFDAGDAANVDFGRAFQAASEFLRDFSKFHGEAPECLVRLPASLAQAKEGSTAGPRAYSLKRRGCEAVAAAAAGFLRATPTTPRTDRKSTRLNSSHITI